MMVENEGAKLLEILREHLEIPENVDYLRLEIAVDSAVRIDCGYYPEKKQ